MSIYDRYPRPAELTDEEWAAGRADLALHLERLSTHPPKRIIDIPVPFADRYFAMMPFDKQFLTADAPTARSFMQLHLVKVQEDLMNRMDAGAMVKQLQRRDVASRRHRSADMAAVTNATPLISLDAVVIDTETTGLDPRKARLLEAAAVRIVAGADREHGRVPELRQSARADSGLLDRDPRHR